MSRTGRRNEGLWVRWMRAGMRLFFKLLYHSMAWTYDLVAATVSNRRWQRWVLSAADMLRGERILELGYGPGHLQVALQRRGLSVFGLDESRQMARQAAARLGRQRLAPRLARGLAQALPYPTASFDSVVATFPTPYIVDPRTLDEIRRVLKPGGRLVVLMSAWITGGSPVDRALGWLFRVTGESPDEERALVEVIAPYQQAGFEASLRFATPPGSRLMFILAERPAQPAAEPARAGGL